MHRRALLLSTLALISACATVPGEQALAPNSTLIVTRHGDRDGEDLSRTGRARAEALVAALDGMALDGIFSPGIARNLDTAAPLSRARDLPVQRLAQEDPVPELVTQGAGKTVLWVGNKGNIARIWTQLRLGGEMPLTYGDLHIIRADGMGRVTIERRRYGPQ
ncbi:histidine phosphatase family protein [Pseudoponticoccus marisrubri]|uniref:Histidine phosphatase family protein n=1 Tax=Pseudoponticoccus marisrubri TaxID=1685382 RepID=A0A0W7WNP2_9RHOB|nr:histidine phosphatase family protein [Pseudoponticoccus marisrubri]KUF12208.1 histidine phosphatase family protein [Pseudoponticoccus marisrubri]